MIPVDFVKASIMGRNMLRGITPTASTWDTPPSSLGNTTDGNLSSVTGTGTKTLTAAGYVGYLIFDLGYVPVKPLLVGGKFGLWADGAYTLVIYPSQSADNVNFNQNNINIASSRNYQSEYLIPVTPMFLAMRYLRLDFYASNALGTGTVFSAKIYEVWAHEVHI